MKPDAVRDLFPGIRGCTYLNAAGLGIASKPALDAVRRHLDLLEGGPSAASEAGIYGDLEGPVVGARRELAHLVSAREDEIALVGDTSSGLHQAIDAIPFREGDNVVLSDLEYPQVALAARNAARADGVEIRFVPHEDGRVSVDGFRAAVDDRTRAILVSSVVWVTGQRVDLAALSDLAARHDAFLVVDAIQELGALPVDVSRLGIDFLCAGGYKWLNAPFGTGVLYVRRETQDRGLRLRRIGLLGLEPPEGGWASFYDRPDITPLPDNPPARTAARFGAQGTPGWTGAAGLAAAVALRNRLGVEASDHILGLADELRAALRERGAQILSPEAPDERTGIVVFTLGGGPAEDRTLRAFLEERRVFIAARTCSDTGGARAAVHLFNDRSDLTALLEGIDAFRREAA